MPEPREHTKHRGAIETVLRHIPGFRGYLEKEYRRESDELQRQWLADRLQRSKRGLDEYARGLVDAGRIDSFAQIDRLRARLDKIIARIRGAMQGYSGMFDLVQIDEKLLDQVYDADVQLMTQVEALADAVENLPAAGSESQDLGKLLAQIDDIDKAWDLRHDLLKGVG